MRSSEASDHRRRLTSRPYSPALVRLTFANVPALGSGVIDFAPGATIICGLNGVGKTTLLKCIFAAIAPMSEHNPFAGVLLAESTCVAEVMLNGQQIILDSDLARATAGLTINAINAGEEGRFLARYFGGMQNLADLLNPLSPHEADAKELEDINYLVGKEYSKCETFEIEDFPGAEEAEEGVRPYFRVTAGGVTYGSEHMGAGELALHLIHWHLSGAPPNSILLFEEPEQYVSPHSQAATVNMLCRVSSKGSVFSVVTSHAPGIVNALPQKHVRLLARAPLGSQIYQAPTRGELDSVLDVPHRPNGLIFVEDKVAREFAVAWLRRAEHELLEEFELLDVEGGASKLGAVLEFPRNSAFRIVGLFDGDQRGRKVASNEKWPSAFLPGSTSPDRLLRDTVRGDSNGGAFIQTLATPSTNRLSGNFSLWVSSSTKS